MQNFDDLDIEGRNPSHLGEGENEKDDYDRKRLMRSSVTAEDGTLRPVYSETEDGDIWCHICNIALFGAHKLISHNNCNRHKMKLDEWPYPVLLWSKRSDIAKATPPAQSSAISDGLAPGEPVPPGMEDQITRTTAIQTSLDRHRSSPLVGLEYLLELVDNDSCEPSYTCVLCDKRGDPRTVMAHITSYNHRITYLNRHFPTISRAITELPRTPNYKRGANEISVLVAKRIEEHFGRLHPQLVEKSQFEKNKIQYIKRVYQDFHFRETPELTFMEVYDVRWVTHFEEKMAEITGNSAAKKEKGDEKPKRSEEKKREKTPPKKLDTKPETTKSGFKIRIFTKDRSNLRKPLDKDEDEVKKSPKRPSDETKSVSSLSSISSSPSPSRSRSRSPHRNRKVAAVEKGTRYRPRSRYSHDRTRSRTRSRSRSPEPLRERDKWDKYREQIRRAEETLDRALKFHEKNPEKHPAYPDEWKKFWNRRYKELQAEDKMKLYLVVIHIALVATNVWVTAHFHEELPEDNEFAEFEDFEEEKPTAIPIDIPIKQQKEPESSQDFDEDDVIITDGDSEFDHFQDEEEFEGLDSKGDEPSTLTITKVPLHLRARWDSFYLEILMIAGLVVYFINYAVGRSKNARIAEQWLNDHKHLLLQNFSLVGDTGKSAEDTSENGLVKEGVAHYSLYCSGRVGCDSMLIELKLINRQDLVSVLAQLVRPQNDQAHIIVELAKDEVDTFVLAVATKKTALHLVRSMADISSYCPEKRPGEKFGLPAGFFVMSEIAEAASAILDTRVLQALAKFAPYIDYIHVSDQYSGPKQQPDTAPMTMPEVKKVLLVGLNISIKGRTVSSETQDKLKMLLQLTFYLIDKLRRFKLSKEGKSKAEKNRLRVEEAFLKTMHAARAEAAAQRREERRRAEKERILQEDDPDKQRKWEEREQRRLAKKRAPKMKQLKMKAL